MKNILGILGGMGVGASIDLQRRIFEKKIAALEGTEKAIALEPRVKQLLLDIENIKNIEKTSDLHAGEKVLDETIA